MDGTTGNKNADYSYLLQKFVIHNTYQKTFFLNSSSFVLRQYSSFQPKTPEVLKKQKRKEKKRKMRENKKFKKRHCFTPKVSKTFSKYTKKTVKNGKEPI